MFWWSSEASLKQPHQHHLPLLFLLDNSAYCMHCRKKRSWGIYVCEGKTVSLTSVESSLVIYFSLGVICQKGRSSASQVSGEKKTFSVHYSQDGMITRLIHMTSLSQNMNQPPYPFLEIRNGTSCTKFRRIRNAQYHPLPDPHPRPLEVNLHLPFSALYQKSYFLIGPAQVLLSVLLAALEFLYTPTANSPLWNRYPIYSSPQMVKLLNQSRRDEEAGKSNNRSPWWKWCGQKMRPSLWQDWKKGMKSRKGFLKPAWFATSIQLVPHGSEAAVKSGQMYPARANR